MHVCACLVLPRDLGKARLGIGACRACATVLFGGYRVHFAMLLRSLARPALISRQLPRHSTILTRAMSVTHVDNTTQLDGILSKSKDKLSVSVPVKRFGCLVSSESLRSLTSMRHGEQAGMALSS